MIKTVNKILVAVAIALIKLYQILLSPILGSNCRHIPSCSKYTIDALKTYGIIYGSWLALKRITRCNPWGTSGYDPVPPKFKFKTIDQCLNQ